jgi:hypothetical protein
MGKLSSITSGEELRSIFCTVRIHGQNNVGLTYNMEKRLVYLKQRLHTMIASIHE